VEEFLRSTDAECDDVSRIVARVYAQKLVPVDFTEFAYASLPLAVIDAPWSVGVGYTTVRNVVGRFVTVTGWKLFAPSREERGEGDRRLGELLDVLQRQSDEANAAQLFQNRQRTSTAARGILKAEAVRLLAERLCEHGIETFRDALVGVGGRYRADYQRVPGQGGVSLSYFRMLIGDDDVIKGDRQVLGWLHDALGRKVSQRQAEALLPMAAKVLQQQDRRWTARFLDGAIWERQRAKSGSHPAFSGKICSGWAC